RFVTSKCAWWTVRLRTMSTASSARRSSSEPTARQPFAVANAAARSGSRSVAATRRISGWFRMSRAYAAAMLPVPTMPIPNGVMAGQAIAYRHAVRLDQIALQLYTVRGLAGTDLAGTLRDVAAAGYDAVELAGLPDTPTRELGGLLSEAGLRVVASHESIERL